MRKVFVLAAFVSLLFAGKANIELFVMSQCPFGTAAENQIWTLLSQYPELADSVTVSVRYILDFIPGETESEDRFNSLHGKGEIEEDIRQCVIQKYFPEKFWKYLLSRNSHFGDTLWQKDALVAGIDTAKLREYVEKYGKECGKKEALYSKKLEVYASPTIYINGVRQRYYCGNFPSLHNIVRNIVFGENSCVDKCDCPAKPGYFAKCEEGECKYTKAPPVNIIVIAPDTTMYTENTFRIINFFRAEVENARVRFVRYDSPEGDSLMKALKTYKLPVYLISKEIREQSEVLDIDRDLTMHIIGGDTFYTLNSDYYPPIAFTSFPEMEGKVDIFIMPECPFSRDLLRTFFDEDFAGIPPDSVTIHYVVRFDPTTRRLSSLHGTREMLEAKRQIVMERFFPEKFWRYLECYVNDGEPDECLKEAGIPKDKLDSLVAENGDSLFIEEAKFVDSLRIWSSPVLMLNNRYILRSSDEIEKNLGITINEGSCK